MNDRRRGWASAALWLLVVHLVASVAPTLTPYDPARQFRDRPLSAPSPQHVLGTDELGRDVFARLVTGTRVSLAAAWLGTLVALAIGACVGLVAGYVGGWVDTVLLRVGDLLLSLPWLYLLLAVRAILPLDLPSDWTSISLALLLGCVGWVQPARSIRSLTSSLRQSDWVVSLHAMGATTPRVVRRLLPHVAPLLTTHALLLAPQFILAESTLSFLGLGAGDAAPSLGTLLVPLQRPHLIVNGWWQAAPAVTLGLLVLLSHRASDRLRSRGPSDMLMP